MRIAQLSPPWIGVPPEGYGGIEWIVSLLAEGLVKAGHDVTVYAPDNSKTAAKLRSPAGGEHRSEMGDTYPDLVHALDCYLSCDDFDIIHDHSGIIGPAIGGFSDTPVLHTLHGPFTEEAKRLYSMLSGRIWFNSISDYQASRCPELSYVGTIYNAIDIDAYRYQEVKDDYLLFLGRFSPLKGAHTAVQVAKKLGCKLLMAGKIDNEEEHAYFDQKVEPYLGGGIEYLGEVSAETKVDLLAGARALLFPIEWAEPFGLVMPEAFVSGTPVIAFSDGSVPEIVRDGVNGYIVEDAEGMLEAIGRVASIDPKVCRRDAVERFSVERMVGDYVSAYDRIVEVPAHEGLGSVGRE